MSYEKLVLDEKPTEEQEINTPVQDPAPAVPEKPALPEKFKGKSFEEVVDAYVKLESHTGKQANELGELRKLTDQILLNQLADKQNTTKEEDDKHEPVSISFDDLVADPVGAIKKVTQSAVKEVSDKLDASDKVARFKEFQDTYKTWKEDLADENFQNWVLGSDYRKNLFMQANDYNTKAARELWDAWGERKEFESHRRNEAREAQTAAKDKALDKAISETGATGSVTKPVFTRHELLKMRQNDPEKYIAMNDEIMLAYKEGRVK